MGAAEHDLHPRMDRLQAPCLLHSLREFEGHAADSGHPDLMLPQQTVHLVLVHSFQNHVEEERLVPLFPEVGCQVYVAYGDMLDISADPDLGPN
jgi:hypothetical protein